MEKSSQRKEVDVEGTFTSTTEELRLKLLDATDAECSKCHSSDIDRMYIDGHDVLHCICNQCGKEWVE
jgi:hypothetical protein